MWYATKFTPCDEDQYYQWYKFVTKTIIDREVLKIYRLVFVVLGKVLPKLDVPTHPV